MKIVPYLLLRLLAGISFFGHGLVRLPKLAGFSAWMVSSFQKSLLPQALVLPFSYLLPITEFFIGLLLLTGLLSRIAMITGVVVMLILIFGTCFIENWEAIPSQLLHAILLVVLLQFISANTFSIDQYFRKKKQS